MAFPAPFDHQIDICAVIVIREKSLLPAVAALGDVVGDSGGYYSCDSCHGQKIAAALAMSIEYTVPEISLSPKFRPRNFAIVIAAAMVLLSVKSQSLAFNSGGMGGPYMQGGGLAPYHGGDPYATFLTMLPVIAGYVLNYVFPSNLSALYVPVIRTGWDTTVIISALILAAIALLGMILHRKKRILFFWYMLFFIGLLPVLQIIPLVTMMNDRYMCFPMLGISVLTCSAMLPEASGTTRRTAGCIFTAFVLFLAVVSFAFVSYNRTAVWKNGYTLWKDTAQKLPNDASVHFKFGSERLRSGYLDEAVQELRLSIKLDPSILESHYNLGVAYAKQALLAEAEKEFRDALAINPNFAEVHFAMGEIFMTKGLLSKSLDSYKAALALNPGYAQAQHKAGVVCTRMGLFEEALRYLEAAVRIAPGNKVFIEDLAAFPHIKR